MAKTRMFRLAMRAPMVYATMVSHRGLVNPPILSCELEIWTRGKIAKGNAKDRET